MIAGHVGFESGCERKGLVWSLKGLSSGCEDELVDEDGGLRVEEHCVVVRMGFASLV